MRVKSLGQEDPLEVEMMTCSSVVLSPSCVWLCEPHGLQHSRPPWPSPSPAVCPSSWPLHRWCCQAISSSDTLFSFCSQSFPASGTLPMSQLFTSDDQNTGILQCFWLKNPTDREPWWATVHGVTRSRTRLNAWARAWACMCTCVCIFFFRFFFLTGYYKILSTVLCAVQLVLLFIYFIYSHVYIYVNGSGFFCFLTYEAFSFHDSREHFWLILITV